MRPERDGIIASLTKRKKHFIRKRVVADAFLARGYETQAAQLHDCEETEILCCCKACHSAWYVKNRCRLRVCPLCSFRVSKERAQYLKIMTNQMKFPKMLTLTMPTWQERPQDGIKFLRKAFARLRRSPIWKGVEGGAYQIELKKKPTGWHIHAHILFSGPFLPYQKIWSTWKGLVEAECPQIRIEAVTSDKAKEYVCKYTSKASDFDGDVTNVVDWYEATKGQRLFATFGKWYNKKINDMAKPGEIFIPDGSCPHCGALKTLFFARDGPSIYGNEIWAEVKSLYMSDGDETRIVPEIRFSIDTEMQCRDNHKETT
jgi:hypothetical protein